MELLAPAGTFDCVLAAVNNGADAVYFAGQSFGARSFAGNLTDEEIFRAADYCHLRGVKAYITVNTLVLDREFKDLEKFVKTITRAGVDAVIVQDMGVLSLIRSISPDIELHASTQMTVHSADGVRELEKLGVSRVVLSRELSGDEIRDIINTTSAEAEVFVHGAMCMSYSGQCLMSSVMGGRSGNRGKCAQPCRLPYSADGKNPKFYLSLKDMSYAEHLSELEAMGVASLKIEGRMKGEAYVSEVVSAYRRLIDEKRLPTDAEKERLSSIFYRGGLTDGYYTDKTGRGMFAFDKPDNPYLKNDNVFERADNRQIPVRIKARIIEGELPEIEITDGKNSALVQGDEPVQTAGNRPLERDNLCAQLSKTGGTAFYAESVEAELSQKPFMAVSAINELRRRAVAALEERILEGYRNKRIGSFEYKKNKGAAKSGRYTCSVQTIEQYRAVCGYEPERIYIPLHIVEQNTDELLKSRGRIVIALPAVLRKNRAEYRKRLESLKEKGFSAAEVSTIDGLAITDGLERVGGFRLNVANSIAADEYIRLGLCSVALSPELNLAQVRDIAFGCKTEIMAYGRAALMLTENCIIKNTGRCSEGCASGVYDRKGAYLPIMKDGDICRSVVLNSVPLYMGDKLPDLCGTGADFLRLVFTTESAEECAKIYELYKVGGKADFEYTRLHYYKGVM